MSYRQAQEQQEYEAARDMAEHLFSRMELDAEYADYIMNRVELCSSSTRLVELQESAKHEDEFLDFYAAKIAMGETQ